MSFSSTIFYLFFILVVIIHYLLPKKYRWVVLLVASYIFCVSADVKFGLLLLVSTTISYFAGLWIDQAQDRKIKKRFMLLGVIANTALLFVFKYLDFFFASVSSALAAAGFDWSFRGLELLLPLGISFYTFQTISYILDVYNGVVLPEKNFGRYALYVSFFPKLVSGPIERAGHLLPQLYEPAPFEYQKFVDSLVRIGWGLFKKLVIADRLAVVANTYFADPASFYAPQAVLAVLFYSFQVYIDFAAYCDIAIGTARILGIDLVENFDHPYFAKSVTEFWRRWHISLSNWLRDYIFIPLNFATRRKRSAFYQYRNILIVFLVSGIWHGANWTFIVWGVLHGLYQVFEAATQKLRNQWIKKLNLDRNSFSHQLFQILLTFALVSFAWVFFRAASIREAFTILYSIVSAHGVTAEVGWAFTELGLNSLEIGVAVHALGIVFMVELLQQKHNLLQSLNRQPLVFRWAVYLVLIFSIIIFGFYHTYQPEDFIYFQF